ncbi:MAG: DotU family type IV/VI secretion system protein [Planctomycetota bacterium]
MSADTKPRANGLPEHAGDVFAFAMSLMAGQDPGGHDEVRGRAEKLIQQFERRNRDARIGERASRDAGLALAALLDEIVMTSSWDLREDWQVRPLAFELFDDLSAGETFFTNLESLRRDPRADELGALEVYATVLALGFRGDFADDAGERKVQSMLHAICGQLREGRGGAAALSPNATGPRTMRAQLRKTPLWMVGVGLFLLVALVAIALHWSLSSRWSEVAATLKG